MHQHLILIVEDDRVTRSFLADQLVADGYRILLAETRQHALHLLAEHRPALVLADINGQTLGLLDAVRDSDGLASKIDPNTPMIVLTARAHELDRVRVFDHGGDDVVHKPFSYPELRGRIRALLRRAEPKPTPISQVGALTVNHRAREVRLDGQQVQLAAKEFDLLQTLITEPTRVFTREELLRTVWGYTTPTSRTVDSHAVRLRKKIASPDQPLVISVWGVGYRLTNPAPTR
jgi:DNA-binding response OmpR family regulator